MCAESVAPPTLGWALACPVCPARPPLAAAGAAQRAQDGQLGADDVLACPTCGAAYPALAGVWSLLAPPRAAELEPFLSQYRQVRRAEQRRYDRTAALALPATPGQTARRWEWRVRQASFRTLVRRVLGPDVQRVVDLGAGNGWLSHRLHRLGYNVAAVDISDDPDDGLGASLVYDSAGAPAAVPGAATFLRLRAEFDALPFARGAADVAVFNASLHYSPDPQTTLAEALRVVGLGGRVIVMDSPIYRRDADGQAMVAERRARFEALYGFPSDRHGGAEYLTDGALDRLADALGLVWRRHHPFYGARYAARPWVARVRRRRPPSRFVVLEGVPQ